VWAEEATNLVGKLSSSFTIRPYVPNTNVPVSKHEVTSFLLFFSFFKLFGSTNWVHFTLPLSPTPTNYYKSSETLSSLHNFFKFQNHLFAFHPLPIFTNTPSFLFTLTNFNNNEGQCSNPQLIIFLRHSLFDTRNSVCVLSSPNNCLILL